MRGVGEWSRQDVRHQADLTVECKVRLRNWLHRKATWWRVVGVRSCWTLSATFDSLVYMQEEGGNGFGTLWKPSGKYGLNSGLRRESGPGALGYSGSSPRESSVGGLGEEESRQFVSAAWVKSRGWEAAAFRVGDALGTSEMLTCAGYMHWKSSPPLPLLIEHLLFARHCAQIFFEFVWILLTQIQYFRDFN